MSIISSVLIFTLYTLYAISNAEDGSITSASDFSFWGTFILVLLPVSIAAKIIIHIVFVIFNKIASNEDPPSFEDELDKIIELKADRISLYVFFLGFILAMVPLVTDIPTYLTFLLLILFGFLSDLMGRIAQLYFYKKGV
ncbi:hypothetical protein [Paenibacillus gorillae]|uniref:hypothetical protein n=1 Tax=Paenibacillus gorillae TaxID=1243662 RepID=UPI0004B05493|nr:hypothetical protein [Paenibacillus gorillae]